MRQDKGEFNPYNELNGSQSFYFFVESKLKPWYLEKDIQWQSFRDDYLWVHEIEMVVTLNDPALKALFKNYCRPGSQFMNERDFHNLFIRDSKIPVTAKMIREAYGMSQQTVILETDRSSYEAYDKCKYVEFLEVIARIAVILF